jgi:UDP-N-acetylmuramoylalanine--D-glutamate ligase
LSGKALHRAIVLGLGTEGRALCRYLRRHGVAVLACDRQPPEALAAVIEELRPLGVEFHLGPDYLSRLSEAEAIYRSPGIPLSRPEIQAAAAAGIPISSQIKLFFDLCPAPVIGVTGTKGKGTTTVLIAEMLRDGPRRVFVGGNIGAPPIDYLEELTPEDLVVLELSSFQLQDLHRSPHVAVVLNITSDHLDYHGTREEYLRAKQSIVRHQTAADVAVVNADYPEAAHFADLTPARVLFFSRQGAVVPGVYVEQEQLWLHLEGSRQRLCAVSEVRLRGRHNLENLAAALAAARTMGAAWDRLRQVARTFPGLEHRLEPVGEIDGVSFYNDSFSTTPETTIAALQSFTEPLLLIAGGSDKGADFTALGEEIVRRPVKRLVLIGDTAGRIEAAVRAALERQGKQGQDGATEAAGNRGPEVVYGGRTMEEIMAAATATAAAGDVVLLSPACASFGLFQNYKDRGQQFKAWVQARMQTRFQASAPDRREGLDR